MIRIVYTNWRGRRDVFHYNTWGEAWDAVPWLLFCRGVMEDVNACVDVVDDLVP